MFEGLVNLFIMLQLSSDVLIDPKEQESHVATGLANPVDEKGLSSPNCRVSPALYAAVSFSIVLRNWTLILDGFSQTLH